MKPVRKVCRSEAAPQEDMTILVRESGAARVVDLEGDVDLGTSPNLRRTLFDLLGKTPKLALNLRALRLCSAKAQRTKNQQSTAALLTVNKGTEYYEAKYREQQIRPLAKRAQK